MTTKKTPSKKARQAPVRKVSKKLPSVKKASPRKPTVKKSATKPPPAAKAVPARAKPKVKPPVGKPARKVDKRVSLAPIRKFGYTPEELRKQVQVIFAGHPSGGAPMTLLRLCLKLGWNSRRQFAMLSKEAAFSEVCEWAKSMCELELESTMLTAKSPTAAMFALKCGYDWRESQVDDQTDAMNRLAASFIRYPCKVPPEIAGE